FFETCQIAHKDSFHGFVVFGGVSRSYTGLCDFDPVFVHLPAGTTGYKHDGPSAITPLVDVVHAGRQAAPDSRELCGG
ncbi:MAG TPA: hypothetical protein VGB13_01160, partial [Candidatus Krumholzibacteria bacterium]